MTSEAPSFRWSFSQWETYNMCPKKWHFQSVMKLPRQPPGPAAARGLDMHDRCEKFIRGEIDEETLIFGNTTLRFGSKKPAVVNRKFLPTLLEIRDHPNGDRHTELKLSFDEDWYQAGTIATGPSVACVMVLDAARVLDGVASVYEWKSGTPKDTHSEQRKLYALGALRKWWGIETAQVTTFYLEDTAPPQRLVVKASAEEKLRELWKGRVDMMKSDNICAPRPGDHCRYMCDFSKSKGGPCDFG